MEIYSLLIIFFSFIVGVVASTEFDFGTLTLSSLKLLGDAHLGNNTIKLTRDLDVPNSGAGKVLYTKPVRFRRPDLDFPASFSSFFSFSISNLNPSSIGGGLAFVITPDDESIGDPGGYLGVMDAKGGQNGNIGVEFDTLMDVEFKDINGNHVGLDLNSMISSEVGDLDSIGVELKSGDLVNSWIDYFGSIKKLDVYVSYSNVKPKEPFISVSIDISEGILSSFCYIGANLVVFKEVQECEEF
ncbi:L-type lectin-domain containing receptor kinase VIII.1 [Capsicum annuum]|uniref:L-type lectin-domain containing receptor kinase VIII.1 n=1 Tax=Capsicum annuum TaxID=4072 RepID=A0A2G2XZN9_CAPAN|nr:L-type lectin-domain containing receptor kinase VIII.1 [Capsicum annuum]